MPGYAGIHIHLLTTARIYFKLHSSVILPVLHCFKAPIFLSAYILSAQVFFPDLKPTQFKMTCRMHNL